MNALVINLISSTDRIDFQTKQLNSLNIDYSVIEAVEAAQLDENFYQENAMSWERPLRKSELACCLSHVLAWERVIKENKPYLILEDDAILHKDTPSALNALDYLHGYDCVNLETRKRKKVISKNKAPLFENYTLSQIISNKCGAAAIFYGQVVQKFCIVIIKKMVQL